MSTDNVSKDTAVQAASGILSWTDVQERECLARLAREVPAGGSIVEIGSLYGGTAAVMALANPNAKILCIDPFTWTPDGYPRPSAKLLMENMGSVGAANVEVTAAPSEEVAKRWTEAIDLLFVDGGHSYEFVHADLVKFGPFAKVIAAHDYMNPLWESVTQAITEFVLEPAGRFDIREIAGMVAVMRWRP